MPERVCVAVVAGTGISEFLSVSPGHPKTTDLTVKKRIGTNIDEPELEVSVPKQLLPGSKACQLEVCCVGLSSSQADEPNRALFQW